MKAELIALHSKNPELRKISKIVESLRKGAVVLYPTDTGFTLGCELGNKSAIEKLRRIRRISDKKSLTFLCNDLAHISDFARVSNLAYSTIKRLIPGPYTFILPATKLVPRLALNPARKTAGIRVPENIISQTLLKEVGEPLISISAKIDTEFQNEHYEYISPDEIINKFVNLVDVVICTDEYDFTGESTVIDMVSDDFSIIRAGAGYDKVSYLVE